VAGISANVTTVASNNSNVSTVASNITDVNTFANRYRIGSTNPTSSLDVGDLFFNTSANELRVYNGSAWQGGVTATGNFATTSGVIFTGDNKYNDNVKAKFGSDSDLQIFHNTSDSIINASGVGNIKLQDQGNTKLEITSTGISATGNIVVSGTVDGRDVATDGTKLDGIEANATADQTAAEIRTLVESASDSNVFTDADHSKLNGIEASATADQTASEIVSLISGQTIAPNVITTTNLTIDFGSIA
jgi:cytoskeletal protein CcmA (bactofilin family)